MRARIVLAILLHAMVTNKSILVDTNAPPFRHVPFTAGRILLGPEWEGSRETPTRACIFDML
jgi:hypothetical protein